MIRRASSSTFVTMLPALLALAAVPAPTAVTPAPPAPWLSQPAVSPDGREIAFTSGGDLWTVPSAGGDARLLVSGPSDDRRPLYSPDGRSIVFTSTRTGNGDLYRLSLADGTLRRLTWDDGVETPDAWSPDGRWIYYSTTTGDIAGMNDLWRVSADGGTPMPVSAERYTNEYYAAPSPDGRALLLCARGIGSSQWWRNGHSHIDESEIWWLGLADRSYRRVIDRGARSLWPMWRADGAGFWFMSDRGGHENLWWSDTDGHAAAVTSFKDGRLLWPSIGGGGRLIAFERDFGLWTFDTQSGAAKPLAVTLRGAAAGPATDYRKFTSFEELALSPDGKKLALIAHGEVFAASAVDGGDAVRLTRTPGPERAVAWAPDSRRLAWAAEEGGVSHLYLGEATGGVPERLTEGRGVDVRPVFSPDGTLLAYVRDGHELRVITLATRQDRLLAKAVIDADPPLHSARPLAWSPDGRWVAFMASGERVFRNAYVVDVTAADPKPVAVSFTANTNTETVSWSSDGSFLVFDTGQRTEPGQVARVDLVPRTPRFRESRFRDLFPDEKKEAPPAGRTAPRPEPTKGDTAGATTKSKRPVEIVTDGIRSRLALLPLQADVGVVSLSPDGKTLVVTANEQGTTNLYAWSLDELAKEPAVLKQLTSSRGAKRSIQWSPDSKTVWYLDDGTPSSVGADGKDAKSVSVTAAMDVDFDAEKEVVFDQAWGWLAASFHDPKMNGADWEGVRRSFAPRVAAARTTVELDRLLSMMVGELNASHLGVRPGADPVRTTGRVGLRFDPVEHERTGALRVASVIPLSPAAVTRKIAPGDWLLAVNGTPLTPGTSLDRLLENTIGRETKLAIASDPQGANRREVAVLPVTQPAEKDLIYREWVEKCRAYVARKSGGRVGYVHMLDMGYASLLKLQSDLDAENMTRDAVVFDVRNNNGGFVNAYSLDILARKHYLNMTQRGWPTAGARSVLGQRALEKPTVLVTNQHSLSDAEDFSEGYRAQGLGPIVGEPTAGWIIYTSDERMIDGSIVRLPCVTITTAAGEPMEMHPRPVDVEVRRALGEDARGVDSQLDAAVEAALKRLR